MPPPAALCLLGLLGPTAARAQSAPEAVQIPSPAGTPILADFYRPEGMPSGAIVLLSPPESPREAWRPLAEALSARGWMVLAADFHRPANEDETFIWRDAGTAEAWLRRAQRDSIATLILGGADLGGTAAAVYASRAQRPPAALLLLSPETELAGAQLAPLIFGLGIPCLVLAARDDLSSDRERALYLAALPRCELWETDGTGRGTQLVRPGRHLLSDLADWCDRVRGAPLKNPLPRTDTGR